jgi:GH35 family endo-1,4-beta-xylanase
MITVKIPSLLKHWRPRLPWGTAYHPGYAVNPLYEPLVRKYYKILTPEVCGCWYWVYGEKNYGWDDMDKLVEYARKTGKSVHYAHLRWWFPDASTQPPDIYAWIYEAMTRYKYSITDWTVCNEVWWWDRQTITLVPDSYTYAKIVNPKARLFYNGLLFQEYEQEAVKSLIQLGLVQAVGVQFHHTLETNYGLYTNFLAWLKSNKVPWRISELDIEIPTVDDPELQMYYFEEQAKQYSIVLSIAREYKPFEIGFWGPGDGWSWAGDHPLLFDKQCKPKPAYYTMIG